MRAADSCSCCCTFLIRVKQREFKYFWDLIHPKAAFQIAYLYQSLSPSPSIYQTSRSSVSQTQRLSATAVVHLFGDPLPFRHSKTSINPQVPPLSRFLQKLSSQSTFFSNTLSRLKFLSIGPQVCPSKLFDDNFC